MNDAVSLQLDDGIARVVLNMPERGNPIGAPISEGLGRVVDHLAAMNDLRVVLLTGAGETFCVGGDIKTSMSDLDALAGQLGESLVPLNAMIGRLASLPVPVVSAVNGPVGGGGISLALCADLVIAKDTAKLRGGYTAIGLSPDLGASLFLLRRVGLARAKRIFFLNEPIDAATGLAWGIYDEVHPAEQFEARVEAVLQALKSSATAALGRTKRLLDDAWRATLEEQLRAEREGMIVAGGHAEAREGITAFLEKRQPNFLATGGSK